MQRELSNDGVYAVKAAFRLINVDKLQVLFLVRSGTFAEMPSPVITGRIFMIFFPIMSS